MHRPVNTCEQQKYELFGNVKLGLGDDDFVRIPPELIPLPPGAPPPPPPGTPPPPGAPPPPPLPEIEDSFYVARVSMHHNVCLIQSKQSQPEKRWHATWRSHLNIESSFYDDYNVANRRLIRFNTGAEFSHNKKWRFSPGFIFENEQLNGKDFRNISGLALRPSWRISDTYQARFSLARRQLRFNDLPFIGKASASENRVEFGLEILLPMRHRLITRVGYNDQKSNADMLNFIRKDYMVELISRAVHRHKIFIRYRQESSDFKILLPTNETRNDQRKIIQAGAHYNINSQWLLTVLYDYEDSDSNEPPFNFNRNKFEILLGLKF